MHKDARRIREQWAAGAAVLGPFLQMPAAGEAEIFGLAGFDFTIIDLEHGAINLETAEGMLRAAHSRRAAPFVRVLANRPELISQALNIGAAGVLVPHVDSAEEGRAVVRSARYAPRGSRGLCPFVRSAEYSAAKGPGYYAEASEDVITGVLLEGREAYEAIDQFLKIEALDIIMIAPYDLSQSFGIPGDVHNPTLIAAVEEICARAAPTDKVVGMFCEEPDRAATWVAAGAQFISTDVDSQILLRASRSLVSQYRAAIAEVGSKAVA